MHKRFQSRLNLIHIEENGKGVVAKVDEFIEKKKNEGIPINLLHKKGSIYKSIVKATEELDADLISAVYEIKGSIKVGHYVPGTRIPILPEAELYKEKDQTQTILNLAWHIPAEVRANLVKNFYMGKVIDIR